MDLASGHVKALIYQKTQNPMGFLAINLGSGRGYSVLEVIQAYEKASGRKIPYEIVGRRPGDIASSYADATLAKNLLNWVSLKDINDMCKWLESIFFFFFELFISGVWFILGANTWNWQQKNPNGFNSS